MSVIIPNAKIATRWNGALTARLRAAPLERFMVLRGLRWSACAESRISDNLATTTIYLVGAAIDALTEDAQQPLREAQYPIVGQVVCAVSSELALLIEEPAHWRTAALVGTARLLEKYIGLSAAAHLAAAAAREYIAESNSGSTDSGMLQVARVVRDAVAGGEPADVSRALGLIVDRLAREPARQARLPPPGVQAYGTAVPS